MSDLECVIWTAMTRMKLDEKLPPPGDQGYAADVAKLFGLNQKTLGDVSHGVLLQENDFTIWMNAKNQLANNQIAIVHQGAGNNGHYLAVMASMSPVCRFGNLI